MKIAQTATHCLKKKIILCGLLSAMLFAFTGCEKIDAGSEEDICAFMEQIAADTERSITEQNATLARSVWSDLTKQGLYVENQGATEIGKAIGRLAATYADLVIYCEDGEKEQLDKFLSDFQTAAQNLSAQIADEGFEVSALEDCIENIIPMEN